MDACVSHIAEDRPDRVDSIPIFDNNIQSCPPSDEGNFDRAYQTILEIGLGRENEQRSPISSV